MDDVIKNKIIQYWKKWRREIYSRSARKVIETGREWEMLRRWKRREKI